MFDPRQTAADVLAGGPDGALQAAAGLTAEERRAVARELMAPPPPLILASPHRTCRQLAPKSPSEMP